MLCDQIFRYYEPENTKSVTKIPNFLKYDGVGELLPLNLCKIKCSNSAISVLAINDSQLQTTVTNGLSRTMQKGFIFIYQDEYLTKLLGVCCVEIYSLTYINFNVRAGEEYDYTIKVHNIPNKEGETA